VAVLAEHNDVSASRDVRTTSVTVQLRLELMNLTTPLEDRRHAALVRSRDQGGTPGRSCRAARGAGSLRSCSWVGRRPVLPCSCSRRAMTGSADPTCEAAPPRAASRPWSARLDDR